MMANWYELSMDKALQTLAANTETGLLATEAARRAAEHGKNVYTEAKKDGIASMVLHQFKDIANVILLLAAFCRWHWRSVRATVTSNRS